MRLTVLLSASVVVFAAVAVDAKRWGGGGASRRGGSGSRPKTPSQPTRTDPFLNSERGHSSGGTTYNRPNPFNPQPAPKPQTPLGFDKVNSPSAPQPPKPPTVQSNAPLGFDKVNSAGGNQQGSHQIGFDKVNSAGNGNPHAPSAPPYPGAPNNGPPPAYYPGTHTGNSYSGAGDHPPAYPGRPVNAPPSYSAGNPYGGQSGYPGQQHGYSGQPQGYPGQPQGYPGQQGFGYPQQNQFGGSSYPSNTGYFPQGGNYPHSTSYQGNNYGGSPFGNNGYNGNPNYNPGNFGYSSNPGYFGSQGGYGHPGQYDGYQKKSRFGGLPIPIPIPIPIPLGGGGFGGFGGFGGNGGYSQNHRLLDTFIKDQNNNTQSGNSSTSVFILNNSTVTPCTTDHFVYDLLKVSVMSCTAEFCTAIKVSTTTNISNIVSVHSAAVTMCSENNVTFSYYGERVTPEVSELQRENVTVCRDVLRNTTVTAENKTVTAENKTDVTNETTTSSPVETTTLEVTTTQESTTAEATTTVAEVATTNTTSNTTRVCESVQCASVQMCLPAIEVVDKCETGDCPFRRTGFKPCITLKQCRSPSTPLSTFASLNTTVSKIDEYNNHNSQFDAHNLTLISYHRPVVTFNCPQNGTGPGCPPPPPSSTR